MIELNELQTKLANIFNEIDTEITIDNPCKSFYFSVLTYGTHLDSVANKTIKKNVIPVYIANMEGEIEPIPTLNEQDLTYTVYIYFPIAYKDNFFAFGNYLMDVFNGKTLNFGANSGKAICALKPPELQEIQQYDFNEFKSFINENYNLPIEKSAQYGVMHFELYAHQVANLGKTNGFLIGNQIKHKLSFEYGGKIYEEDLITTSAARNLTSETVEQQGFNDYQTEAVAKNTTYINSVEAYVRENDFWLKFIELYETGLLQNITFKYTRTYEFSDKNVSYTFKSLLTQCPSEDSLGEVKTFTFAFAKKISDVEIDIETTKLIKPTIAIIARADNSVSFTIENTNSVKATAYFYTTYDSSNVQSAEIEENGKTSYTFNVSGASGEIVAYLSASDYKDSDKIYKTFDGVKLTSPTVSGDGYFTYNFPHILNKPTISGDGAFSYKLGEQLKVPTVSGEGYFTYKLPRTLTAPTVSGNGGLNYYIWWVKNTPVVSGVGTFTYSLDSVVVRTLTAPTVSGDGEFTYSMV